MKNIWLKEQEFVEFWENDSLDISKRDIKIHNIESIEIDVMKWLKDDKADSVLTFYIKENKTNVINLVNFYRYETSIRICRNVWQLWRIARCSNIDKLFSYRVKEFGTNDAEFASTITLPNEIKENINVQFKDQFIRQNV